jgi:glc operon protein GlcG
MFRVTALATAAVLSMAVPASAQIVPAYGPSINLETAKKAVDAAAAEAAKNGWKMAIAVTSIGGYLVAFSRMDDTQLASNDIAVHKAKAAATYRRPTKAFADALAANPPNLFVLTLDGVIAADGGLPIVKDGKVIGGIGCSGATGAQDAQACTAGLNAIK